MKTLPNLRSPAGLHGQAIKELTKKGQEKKRKKLATFDGLLEIKKERMNKELAIRPMLFNIGMAASMLIAVVAMNWKSYDRGDLVDLGKIEADVSEIIEIPISEQPPPPPPKQEVFAIKEVKDTEIIEELEMTLDVEVTADAEVEEIDYIEEVEVEKEVVDEVFTIVEQEPLPKGGMEAFYKYVAEELEYPRQATRLGTSGRVYLEFVIEKDGSITQVKVIKGIGAGCDEEAVRVISNAPNWEPGKQRGVPVRVRKIMPINFILNK